MTDPILIVLVATIAFLLLALLLLGVYTRRKILCQTPSRFQPSELNTQQFLEFVLLLGEDCDNMKTESQKMSIFARYFYMVSMYSYIQETESLKKAITEVTQKLRLVAEQDKNTGKDMEETLENVLQTCKLILFRPEIKSELTIVDLNQLDALMQQKFKDCFDR